MDNFVGVDRAYAIVKEEMKSYFYTNIVDDSLFDSWTKFALSLFQGSTYPVKSVFLPIENYEVGLPKDFHKVKELWACGIGYRTTVQNPTSTYYQKDCRITPIDDKCHECFSPCDGDMECTQLDPKYRVTHKITGHTVYEYWFSHLLKPADRATYDYCGRLSPNIGIKSKDEFVIDGRRLITTFQEGGAHLIFHADNIDEDGNYLIVDEPRVEDYLIKHLKFKTLEMVSNSTTDETFNQIERKLMKAESDKNIAFIAAETELKKRTKYDVAKLIKKRRGRFSEYRNSLR